jgi:acyl-coenzyme A synthetase/AMP-(fatty) acid ligase
LTKLGFSKGDVLCMYCSNYVDYWLIVLAAWSCGGCVMPVNCELEVDALEMEITEAKVKVIEIG